MDADEPTPFKMNLPVKLKEQLTEKAKDNHRSLSGEIIHRLQKTLVADALSKSKDTSDFDKKSDDFQNRMTEMEEKLEALTKELSKK